MTRLIIPMSGRQHYLCLHEFLRSIRDLRTRCSDGGGICSRGEYRQGGVSSAKFGPFHLEYAAGQERNFKWKVVRPTLRVKSESR